MNNYLKTIVICLIIMMFTSGCASYMVYKNSEQKVAARKAFARGDQVAIKAIQLGNDGVGIGIDVSNWEALKEQPLLQLGAAILDAGLVYGGYKGVESLNENDKEKGVNITINGDKNNTTIIRDGNTTTATPNYDSNNSSGE